ncbi:hypothetical protein ABH926_001514 [Catenulispora sp. GP43]|uniref:hypothetical protein n=1 Tax=Catenulispora sp. GP43 TaxID=3156263 RepID=UPI003512F051
MSHEVVFLPHILGQTWSQALAAARTAAREEDPRIVAARLEPWPDLVLHAAQILGQIEEYRGRGQRELVHPVTRLRFTFFGEDGVIALPYWYDGPVARMAATMAFRFAHAVESDTGLAAYDPQQRTPLAEMGLEKFVAGYLRGRERALGQAQARGPVPVGHALPTGRSSTRRELSAGPSAGGDSGRQRVEERPAEGKRRGEKPASRQGSDSGQPRKGPERRPAADAGPPTSAGRLKRVDPSGRSEDARGRDRRDADGRGAGAGAASGAGAGQPVRGADSGGQQARSRESEQRRTGQPVRREDPAISGRPRKSGDQRPPIDQRPPADPGRQRRVAPEGAGGREKVPPRPRQNPDSRPPEEPSSGGWLRRGKGAKKPQRGSTPPGAEWVPRPGSPEPRGSTPPDSRAQRRDQPQRGDQPPRRGDGRRAGEPPQSPQSPQPPQPRRSAPPDDQRPPARRTPPESPPDW